MGTGSFPGVKSGRGVTLTPHPLLVPLVKKEYSYTSTPPMGRTACSEPQRLYKGDLYLYNIIHSVRLRRISTASDGIRDRTHAVKVKVVFLSPAQYLDPVQPDFWANSIGTPNIQS
jgi:hypothetical protein